MKCTHRMALVASLALCSIGSIWADSDDPPLFVNESGVDTGTCQSAEQACKTLAYALSKVGKNGKIRVGNGTFEIGNFADITYALSNSIDVQGGYGDGAQSTLVGIPPEFSAALSNKGFRVIADSKGSQAEATATQLSVMKNTAASVCTGGFADVFPCDGVDLLAHLADRTPSASGADVWGFQDLNTHREYAIMSYRTGTAVFDVSDPENPREVRFINGQSTTWRDIKVHQFWNASQSRWNAYAYVTSDNTTEGLFIIDLSQLPHRVARIAHASDFSGAHNVFISGIEYGTGLSTTADPPTLIVAGSDQSDGRFRSYSLADPRLPAFISAPATPAGQAGGDRLYMHDAASMTITGPRKDTQCVNAINSDYCSVLFDFNESTADIWDITDPTDPQRLSQLPYPNSRYTHSGWPSEDQQYLFIQDELDERDFGLQTTLRVVDISDLTSPSLAGSWTGPTRAIDHNGFVRGNRYYMSNYARGFSILDISNSGSPVAVGRFDTYLPSDNTGFPGNWGTYPFFPSGHIALSDIDSGFYLVADRTLDVEQGSLAFTSTSYGGDEASPLAIEVQRLGGNSNAVDVRWEVIAATGGLDDISSAQGTLSWAAGDSGTKSISLGPIDDGLAEGLEQVLVKLSAPGGGATLSAPSIANVYLSDPGSTSTAAFSVDAVSVPERGFGMAIAVIQRSGSSVGAMSVDYAVNAGTASNGADYSGPVTGTVNWEDGDATPKWIEYTISDDGSSEADEFFEVELSNPSGGSLGVVSRWRATIENGSGNNRSPNAVAGVSQTVRGGVQVTLDGTASNDPDGDTLTYAWSQTLGPSVTLTGANSASASFTSPNVSSDTILRFELTVGDALGVMNSSTANVTVTGASAPTNGGGGGGGSLTVWFLALLGLLLLSQTGASLLSSARGPVQSK